jgi:nucleoside-triphosphatase THEP1
MARWALISGEKGHNKAELTLEMVARLKAGGAKVGGFVQLRHIDAQEQKGYELLRLTTGERITLAVGGVAAKGASQEAFCTYAFRNDAFEQARRWLQADAVGCDVLVLDDISKLEVQGKGHAASLTWALAQEGKMVLICARASQLFYVVENFALADDPVDALELPVDGAAHDRFVRSLLSCIPRS